MFKYLLISISLLLSGLLLGCGSGSGESTAPTLTKAQFIKQANAICSKAETEQFKEGTHYLSEHPGISDEKAILAAGLPPIERELSRLNGLSAPEGEADPEDFLAALETALAKTKEDPRQALSQKENPFERANQLAKSHGLESCAGNP